MATAEQLTKLTTAELKARCLDTAGCITKQDYVDRILEEEAMAWDHIEGSYEDEGQYDDETGIKDHAAREADAKEEPVAPPPAAAPSNGANRKHKPIVWPSSTEASKAAAGMSLEPIRSLGAKSAAASAPSGPAPKKMKDGHPPAAAQAVRRLAEAAASMVGSEHLRPVQRAQLMEMHEDKGADFMSALLQFAPAGMSPAAYLDSVFRVTSAFGDDMGLRHRALAQHGHAG